MIAKKHLVQDLEQSISLKYNGIEKSIHENALIIKYAIDLLSDYI